MSKRVEYRKVAMQTFVVTDNPDVGRFPTHQHERNTRGVLSSETNILFMYICMYIWYVLKYFVYYNEMNLM